MWEAGSICPLCTGRFVSLNVKMGAKGIWSVWRNWLEIIVSSLTVTLQKEIFLTLQKMVTWCGVDLTLSLLSLGRDCLDKFSSLWLQGINALMGWALIGQKHLPSMFSLPLWLTHNFRDLCMFTASLNILLHQLIFSSSKKPFYL